MSRPARIALRIAAAVAALVVILVIAAILVVRTEWFRGYVKQKIVSYAGEATGGTVEIGAFRFDWTQLRAEIDNAVIHGTEGPDQHPLFRARQIALVLRLLPSFTQTMDLQSLDVKQPRVNVIVYPDGHTNVPAPKGKPTSNKTVLEDLVDLAIRRFNIEDGSILFAERRTSFNAQGENLRTQLSYNMVGQTYDGRISMDPLYVQYGENRKLALNVALPVHMERDKIQFTSARISTPQSEIAIDGSIQHLTDPRTEAHVKARIALQEVKQTAGPGIPLDLRGDLPKQLTADVAFTMDKDRIQITSAQADLGQTSLRASGALQDQPGSGAMQFDAKVALGELGRMFNVAARPEGTVQIAGNARLTRDSGYVVTGDMQARDLAFREGAKRYSNIELKSAIRADQNAVELSGIRLAAFGGEFTGKAALEPKTDRFRVDGDLRRFDIARLARTFANQSVAYDGSVSGPIHAEGNWKRIAAIQASAHLAIAPGKNGIPVSGRLNAQYNGATGAVDVGNSFIALPSSRLELSGSLNRQIQVNLTSRNLNDFLPALGLASVRELPASLQRGGAATFNGTVSGNLNSPRISGHVLLVNFVVQDRPFDRLAADLDASSSGASLSNASLSRGALQATFAANVGLRNWKAESYEPLSATANIQNADVSDLLALAGQKDSTITGALNANARVTGTVGNPQGAADITVVNGTAYDEHFDQFTAHVNLSDQLVAIPNARITAGTARIDMNASFRHPRDSFETGVIEAHLASNQVALDQFSGVKQRHPSLSGGLQLNADLAANLRRVSGQEQFDVTNVNANFKTSGLLYEGERFGDIAGTVRTAGKVVDFRADGGYPGRSMHVAGQTRLEPEYPTTATASISGFQIERLLAIAGRKDVPVSGNLSADAQVSGTLSDPSIHANFTLAKANVYEQPIDSLTAEVKYTKQAIEIPSLRATSGAGNLTFDGAFMHPPNNFESGQVRFTLKTTAIQISKLEKVQQLRPGLAGTVAVDAKGAGRVQNVSGEPPLLLSSLDANMKASNLALNKEALGDASFTAQTRGSSVSFQLASNIAGSDIQGGGELTLSGDYPVQAQVSFKNLTYARLAPLLGVTPNAGLTQSSINGVAEGSIRVSGPARKPEELTAAFQIPRLEVTAARRGAIAGSASGSGNSVTLRNQGPIVASLNRSVIHIESARIVGPNTDIAVTGTATLRPKQDLNVNVDATTNLSILQDFNRNLYSSGAIVLHASIRGALDDPRIYGDLRLNNAALNLIDAPNGISNANGVIAFNGKTAVIQSFTAESGGGQISASGDLTFGGAQRFRLTATASNVRVRYPESVSTVADASLTLTGTSDRSTLAGTVTIDRIQFNPHSDFGSVLTSSSPPVRTPSAPNSLLASIHLQVRIRTAPGVQFQTALAQNIEAVADLRVRGTLDEPAVLGRVSVTQGEIVFFGTKYTVDQGSVAFYNPVRVEPVLDIDLETNVQGVNVILTVSGTVDNLNLTYRSDPPLPFNQVLGLLAAGKTPANPTIAARQPQPPAQSLQQVGESAILQQVVANPLSNRLERVFGITELKIAPAFVSGSVLPQARVTLSQQITQNLSFTYITDVANTNEQIIQVEWAINPQWSAVATRDQNGLFGIDFYYKKKFK